uniref:Uncharacterized protein n=1 Tax=viral metagenome TaxID=1070528 RepID=A0A6M3JU13_9ZZZZ
MKYKLTDQNDCTQGTCQWGENVTNTAKKGGPKLCTDTVIHYYDHPLLAVLLNPIHTNIKEPHLWEGKGRGIVHDGLKGGSKSFTTTKRIPLPTVTTNQRVRFGILITLEVYHDERFRVWAAGWLTGTDRSKSATDAATDATYSTYAAYAAYAAGVAAYAAGAAAPADASRAAYAAARAAAYAAADASRAASAKFNRRLIALAKRAIKEEA